MYPSTVQPGYLRICITHGDRNVAADIPIDYVPFALAEYELLGSWRLDQARGLHSGAGAAAVDCYKAVLEGRNEAACVAALWLALNQPDQVVGIGAKLAQVIAKGGTVIAMFDELMTERSFIVTQNDFSVPPDGPALH